MTTTARKLSSVAAGSEVRLLGVDAGRSLSARLASMGMVRGVRIHVMRSGRGGPLVVSVSGGRVVLGRGVAEQMRVGELPAARRLGAGGD